MIVTDDGGRGIQCRADAEKAISNTTSVSVGTCCLCRWSESGVVNLFAVFFAGVSCFS